MKEFKFKIRWTFFKIVKKLQKWSPIVSKKKFKEVEKHTKYLSERISANEKDFAKQLESIREKNSHLFKKLIPYLKVEGFAPDYGSYRPDYRITTTVGFAPQIIEQSLIHGNDSGMIEYIADEIKYCVEKELKTINFVRYKRDERT